MKVEEIKQNSVKESAVKNNFEVREYNASPKLALTSTSLVNHDRKS
jgi:hypothetical protein